MLSREGQKNLPNVVWIVSREWQLWIKRGGQRSGSLGSKAVGVKKEADAASVALFCASTSAREECKTFILARSRIVLPYERA
jgi:hypothetical protein